jgi:hypothetical protein
MVLLSTSYFPPISWLALLYQQKEVSIDLWETYQKQSYRNRCRIATSNGLMDLSIPVKKPNGNHSRSNEIILDDHQNWRQQHWRSIKNAYQSTPFFIHYEEGIHSILFDKKTTLLWELNHHTIKFIADQIHIDYKIEYTNDFIEESNENDFRFKIHPKHKELLDYPDYYQVFDDKIGFQGGLSSLDLLFNLGPEAIIYLDQLPEIIIRKK